MSINILAMWNEMGWPVRSVVLVLTLQAMACLSVVFDRLLMTFLSRRAGKRFAKDATPFVRDWNREELLAQAQKHPQSHLANLVSTALRTYQSRLDKGENHTRAVELTKRTMERKLEENGESLFKGMNVLASTGSTAPFVGLLGTVLGIIQAFHQIASQGSGGIGTIGASIGEALIVTGYGLLVAIPTVLIFNALSTRVGKLERELGHAVHEVLDTLESDGATTTNKDARRDRTLAENEATQDFKAPKKLIEATA